MIPLKPDVTITSQDVLDAMHMHVRVHVTRTTVWVVAVRLWLSTQLIRLAALVGGCSIEFEEGPDAGAEGEGG